MFGSHVRAFVRAGAEAMIVITDDASLGMTSLAAGRVLRLPVDALETAWTRKHLVIALPEVEL